MRTPRTRLLQFVGLGLAFSLAAITPLSAQAAAPAAENTAPRQSVKLLHIGNSFSNNATSYLPALAKAGGKDLLVAGTILGGCSLERHAKHLAEAKAGDPAGSPYATSKSLKLPAEKKKISVPEALEAQEWDFVTIQQRSASSFLPESYEPYATQLISEIKEKAPQATILIHQTWPYRPDHALLAREKMTPEQMYEGLVDAYSQLGERHGLGFLPSGNAVYAATQTPEWSYSPDPDYNYDDPNPTEGPKEKGLYPGNVLRKDKNGKLRKVLDASHMNPAGRYLTGCVWYEILFNDSVLDVNYTPKGLTPEQTAQLRRIAHETVAAYRANGNKL